MSSSYSHGLRASVAFQENTMDRLQRQHLVACFESVIVP